MWQYFNENDTGVKWFLRSACFDRSFEARDIGIMRDIVFFQHKFFPQHFQRAIIYHRFWETLDIPESRNILLSKIKPREPGDTCPYLESLWNMRNREVDVARKALFDTFVKNGHATSTDNNFFLEQRF
jgi:hypothetical protein